MKNCLSFFTSLILFFLSFQSLIADNYRYRSTPLPDHKDSLDRLQEAQFEQQRFRQERDQRDLQFQLQRQEQERLRQQQEQRELQIQIQRQEQELRRQ